MYKFIYEKSPQIYHPWALYVIHFCLPRYSFSGGGLRSVVCELRGYKGLIATRRRPRKVNAHAFRFVVEVLFDDFFGLEER